MLGLYVTRLQGLQSASRGLYGGPIRAGNTAIYANSVSKYMASTTSAHTHYRALSLARACSKWRASDASGVRVQGLLSRTCVYTRPSEVQRTLCPKPHADMSTHSRMNIRAYTSTRACVERSNRGPPFMVRLPSSGLKGFNALGRTIAREFTHHSGKARNVASRVGTRCTMVIPKRCMARNRGRGIDVTVGDLLKIGAVFGVGCYVAVLVFPFALMAVYYISLAALGLALVHFILNFGSYRQMWQMGRQMKKLANEARKAAESGKPFDPTAAPFRNQRESEYANSNFAQAFMGMASSRTTANKVQHTYELACYAIQNDSSILNSLKIGTATFTQPTELSQRSIKGQSTLHMRFRIEFTGAEAKVVAYIPDRGDPVLKEIKIQRDNGSEKQVDLEMAAQNAADSSGPRVVKEAEFRDL